MKGLIASIMITACALALGPDIAQAQNLTGSLPLGDVARQLNAQRSKSLKKPRVFTNDDVAALRKSSDQSAPSAAISLSTWQVAQGAAPAPVRGWAKAKFRVALGQVSDAATLAKHPDPSPGPARTGQAGPGAAPGPTGEWAKAKYRASTANAPATSEPGPIPAPSPNPPPPPRQDLGYVERANGLVEAIVAEGQHVGLIQETEEFVKNFHDPAPSNAEVEFAQASPQQTNLPPASNPDADQTYASSSAQESSGSPSPAGGVEVATAEQPQAASGENGGAPSEASATPEPEALADYTSAPWGVKPPETVQPAPCPVTPPPAPEAGLNRSLARPLGYVEKASGEKEAIVEFRDQVYLVHEGELFADKFRALRVSPSSVEIVEEFTEASTAPPARRRNANPLPDSQ